MSEIDLNGKRVLITGPTGQVAKPVALALAKSSEVIGIARFNDAAAREQLEAAGVRCIKVDLASGDFSDVPDDVDYVLNLAVTKTQDFDYDIAANAEATGLLMSHCRKAKAFLHCSSTAVYQPNGHHAFVETDPLGDNHRVPAMSFMPTYSVCKIAAEAMARFGAREYKLPTIIARLNVPYGNNGGWPWMHMEQVLAGQPVAVHVDEPSVYNPIHEDDIIASIPKLLAHASVPATIVNWGGNDAVSIEEWTTYIAELVGKPATFVKTDQVLQSVTIDLTKQHQLIGPTTVHWKDGMRRMVQAFHPEIELQA
ncbi:MAG TPA: NAD(P)-dependent oxidoreductase [Acidimicrobiales bacterium]